MYWSAALSSSQWQVIGIDGNGEKQAEESYLLLWKKHATYRESAKVGTCTSGSTHV